MPPSAAAVLETGKPSTRKPNWPVGLALLTAWWCPATTARRTQHAALWRAWLVHFFSVILAALVIVFLAAWADAPPGASLLDIFINEFTGVLDEFVHEYRRDPVQVTAGTIGVILAIQMMFVGLATCATPWGAKDEPLRKSFRNAIRYAWLHTPALIPAILAVGCSIVILDRVETTLGGTHPPPSWPSPPPPVGVPKGDPAFQQASADHAVAMADFNAQLKVVQKEWNAYFGQMPWYIRNWEMIVVPIGFVAGGWLLWGLFRGVGARREVAPIARPPTCEACGYNLSTIPLESRCPECGAAVADSLGPHARPGAIWQRRHDLGRFSAWWRCAARALRRPDALGRDVRLIDPGTDHRRYFALHLPFIFVIGMGGLFVATLMAAPDELWGDEFPVFLLIMSMFAIACVVGTVMFTMFGVCLVGGFQSLSHKRNLLPGAVQIACYLTPMLVLWAMFGAGSAHLLILLEQTDWLDAIAILIHLDTATTAVSAWFVPNIACGVAYLAFLSRGTATTCYANR